MAKKKDSKKTKSFEVPRITGPRTLNYAPGFKDRIGPDSEWWWYFKQVSFEVMQKYNFNLFHPSSVEYTNVYSKVLGKDHEMVQDNLIMLHDREDNHLSLRPNFESTYLRAYATLHKTDIEGKVIPIHNWYSMGAVYGDTYDTREKHQLYISVVGNDHPVVDAECTVAAFRYLEALGFKNIRVLVNSVGDNQSKANYKKELSTFLKERKREVSDECKGMVTKSPMEVLMCEHANGNPLVQDAPQSVDWLSEDDKNHFIRVLEYLDELEIPYMLSPELMPEHPYHEQTIMGIQVTTDEDVEYILATGGRYDGLSRVLSPELYIPAMQMTIDLDKCLTAVRTAGMKIPEKRLPQVFLAQLGDEAKKRALVLRELLHAAGMKTVEHFGHDSLKNQLEEATELGVKITCILGQKELMDGTILVRDMDGGIQEEVPQDKLVQELQKRLM